MQLFYKFFRTSSEPLLFYRNLAKDVFTVDDAVNIIVKRYNTPERQARVHTNLESLRFTSFIFGEKFDAFSTLTALASELTELLPLGPPQYQVGFQAVEHLRNVVLCDTWANDVLCTMNAQTISEFERTSPALFSSATSSTPYQAHRIWVMKELPGVIVAPLWPERCTRIREHTENLALLDPPRWFRKVGRIYLAMSPHGEGCIGTGPCSDPGHFAERCAYRSDIVEQICLDI
jgi:hypothetical protein